MTYLSNKRHICIYAVGAEGVGRNQVHLLCSKGSGIATGQTAQIATLKCMAKRKRIFLENSALFCSIFIRKGLKQC